MTAHIAPIPIPTAGTSSMPGSSAAATPPAAPMNIAGNTGPPRKLDSEIAYASALQSISSSSAPTDQLAALLTTSGSWSWPEKSTSEAGWPVASENPIASPPIRSAQHRHEQHHAGLDPGADGEREELDPAADERRHQPDRERPAEHRERERAGVRQVRARSARTSRGR